MSLTFFNPCWHANSAHLLPAIEEELLGFRLESSALRNGDHKR
jgi:hypothetical protein